MVSDSVRMHPALKDGGAVFAENMTETAIFQTRIETCCSASQRRRSSTPDRMVRVADKARNYTNELGRLLNRR